MHDLSFPSKCCPMAESLVSVVFIDRKTEEAVLFGGVSTSGRDILLYTCCHTKGLVGFKMLLFSKPFFKFFTTRRLFAKRFYQ